MLTRLGILLIMNKLSTEKRAQVIAALVEGVSINATVRMTNVSKPTILKLLKDLGCACAEYQDRTLRGLKCRRLQCDEIWSFVLMKQKNIPAARVGEWGIGDVWTWTAIDADTKIIPSWLIGPRDAGTAHAFIEDLASRLTHRVQLTTDGLKAYLDAVYDAFGGEVDFSQLVKLYGAEQAGEARYSPPKCIGCRKTKIIGKPDPEHVSTSYVERQNLSMRMGMRRFTRLTNAHSKKVENHEHAVALYFMHYNFARVHMSLRVTPAMEARIADHVWSLEEIVGLLDRPV